MWIVCQASFLNSLMQKFHEMHSTLISGGVTGNLGTETDNLRNQEAQLVDACCATWRASCNCSTYAGSGGFPIFALGETIVLRGLADISVTLRRHQKNWPTTLQVRIAQSPMPIGTPVTKATVKSPSA